MSSLHTAYQSQSTNTPSSIIQALVMSQPGSRAASPTPPQFQGPRGKPHFQTSDIDAPSRGELLAYCNSVDTYLQTIQAVLQFINVPDTLWPPPPDLSVENAVRSAGTIYRRLSEIDRVVGQWEFFLSKEKLKAQRALTAEANTRASTVQPNPYTTTTKLKVPRPTAFNGKRGDPAFTFIAACNNYGVMDPNAFSSDEVFIRWALQQMNDQAGQWSVMQMMRLDTELDSQGRVPKELRKWKNFCEHFLNQFGDLGLIEKAKNQWKQGLNQTGKAVDYFQKVEEILLRLAYPRDSEMVLDQVQMGLKTHIRTHFIGRNWQSLNGMKVEIIPFNSAHWEINHVPKATGEKTKTYASGSKATTTQPERSKSQTPNVKTETAKTGTNNQRYLPQEEFELCKKNRWCFMCKREGKEVVRSARFHPNH